MHNYKKAGWAAINSGLNSIDWENEFIHDGDIHENWYIILKTVCLV